MKKEKSRENINLEKKSVGDVNIIQTKPMKLDFPESKMKKEKETFEGKLLDQFMKLINQADFDKSISGNSYWEFTDRKIEVINPIKIKSNKKGVIICPRRLTKDKLYGKSILE